MSVTQALANLRARFDRVALQAPTAGRPDEEEAHRMSHQQAWAQLTTWCQSPSALAGQAAWHGKASNDFAVATLKGPSAAAWAQAFARHLDGSVALEALPGRPAGLAWRARIKLHDAMWWRPRSPSDPWDAGWASTSPPAERQLRNAFMPRRPTLILASAEDHAGLALAFAALGQRCSELQFPLRWLWVGEPTAPPAAAHLQASLTLQLRSIA